jgi:hypothetical protein
VGIMLDGAHGAVVGAVGDDVDRLRRYRQDRLISPSSKLDETTSMQQATSYAGLTSTSCSAAEMRTVHR